MMIKYDNGLFHIETENTSYIFSVEDTLYPEHVYYGRRLRSPLSSIAAIREKHLKAPHMSTLVSRQYGEFSLDDTLLEFSTEGKGDYKTPLVTVSGAEKGDRTLDLKYSSHQITPGIVRFRGPKMPQAVAEDGEAETLAVTYTDKSQSVRLTTYYTSFYKADIITRRTSVQNESNGTLTVNSIYSSSLDVRAKGVRITSLSGAWGREKHLSQRTMSEGTFTVESRTIQSGSADPTVIIENGKDTYLSSLVYSGAHRTTVTQTVNGITHLVCGINPDLFSWKLEKGEIFESPEAVLAYSPGGCSGVGLLMRKFIEDHIRRGTWKNKMKPVMLSTWEALSYDPDEAEVLKMAHEAKKLGMEGIVVDDGWFGARSDSTSSLGDWYADTRHFPSGIKDLANEVHYMGLMFGLWFEMEGINERSMLYRAHPDWIVGRSAALSSEGNHELLLDITRSDVQDWVISSLGKIIEESSIDYIKWSLSRMQGDLWSNSGDRDSGEFMHRYLLGLYRILDTITKTFPRLYIEGTSSGGMRFDMGMLSYCSSITATECTDVRERMKTIEGTALVYPLSVIGVLLSPSRERFTARTIENETAFNASVFGVLSSSVNPHELSKIDKFILKQQIEFYKAYRILLQCGRFTVQEDSPERTIWTVSDGDGSTILMLYYMKEAGINTSAEKLYIECANEKYDYLFMPRPHMQNRVDLVLRPQENECYNVSGDALKWAGITLADNISGNGYEEGMRCLGDNTSRLYIIRKREDKQ